MSRFIGLVLAIAGVFSGNVNTMGQGYGTVVTSYQAGSEFTPGYDNPAAALGEPSRETPGQFGGPVDPFSPPYLAEQLVSIGAGGSLTIEFASPITNDPKNPFGLDFIIFGNAGFVITNGDFSGGGITDGSLFSSADGTAEIWVSADGSAFYQLSPALAPPLDGLFPTDGSGNFHQPVNPSIQNEAFSGHGLPGIRDLYAGSGGGAGFDLAWARDEANEPVELASVRFLRVTVSSGHIELDAFADVTPAGIPQKRHEFDFTSDPLANGWQEIGAEDLFDWHPETGVEVTWDSRRPNSYFAFPLGLTLHRGDDFTLDFTFHLEEITRGIDPTKPFTFQIAAGLIHLANATDPAMHRGAGINPEHGPRNIVEWTYFPDSGFGATVGPTAISGENQLVFSSNHPLEIISGRTYRVEMTFSGETQSLTTRMWENGQPFGMGPEKALQPLVLPGSFTDFAVDAFAISSYSDAGQDPEFAGSVYARAQLHTVSIALRNKPQLIVSHEDAPVIEFASESGWRYFLERSTDGRTWTGIAGPLTGGGDLRVTDEQSPAGIALYRARGERLQRDE